MSNTPLTTPGPIERRVLVAGLVAVLALSYIGCTDALTWFMEIVWVLIGLVSHQQASIKSNSFQ